MTAALVLIEPLAPMMVETYLYTIAIASKDTVGKTAKV